MADNRILIIDDDMRLSEMLVEYLAPEGIELTTVPSGIQGLRNAQREAYDLIILDVMLPGLSGFEVLKQLREGGSRTPVLMLTARGDDVDRIVGLDLGADDYLPKPFNPRELLARIKAILRRTTEAESEEPDRDRSRQAAREPAAARSMARRRAAQAHQRGVRDSRHVDARSGRGGVARVAHADRVGPAIAARRSEPRYAYQQPAPQGGQRRERGRGDPQHSRQRLRARPSGGIANGAVLENLHFFTIAMTVTLTGAVYVSFRLRESGLRPSQHRGPRKIIEEVAASARSKAASASSRAGSTGTRGVAPVRCCSSRTSAVDELLGRAMPRELFRLLVTRPFRPPSAPPRTFGRCSSRPT